MFFGRSADARRLAGNVVWMFLGQGLSVLCQGAYFICLGRLLGSTEYGIYVGAFALVSFLSQYSTLGSQVVLLRYVSIGSSTEDVRQYWGNVLFTVFALGGTFVLVLSFLDTSIARSAPPLLVTCVALSECVFAQITTSASKIFQACESMGITAGLNLLTNLLRAAIAGFLLWHQSSATAVDWGIAVVSVSMISATSALTIAYLKIGTPKPDLPLLKRRLGEGFVYSLSVSTTGIYNDVDKLLLGYFGLNIANGIYAMAYRIVDAFMLPITAVHAAMFPRFFKKGTEGIKSTMAYAIRLLRRTAPAGLLLGGAMFALAPAIPMLLGDDFSSSSAALRWLCLLPLLRSFHMSAGDALTGAGLQKMRLYTQSAMAVANFAVNLLLIPRFGWEGAARSSLATDGLLGILNWLCVIQAGSRLELSPPTNSCERAPA